MVMPCEIGTKGGVKINVIAAGLGLVGVIDVTKGRKFTLNRKSVDGADNIAPLERRLNEILAEESLPLSVPNSVEYCDMNHPHYPYAVAEAFRYKQIANLVVRGEVCEKGKDYSGN